MKGKRRRRYLWREVIWLWPWKEGGGVFHEKKKKEVEEGQILVWEMRTGQRKKDKYKRKDKKIETKQQYKIVIKNYKNIII